MKLALLARALRDDLNVLYTDSITDDGTDDLYCPWFTVLAHRIELIAEFAPEGFSLRTYSGLEMMSLSHDEYTAERVLTWFMGLTTAAGLPHIVH
ncbi:hypothetical protein [Variovorax paradoxus]|uniref:hypothetical protein n=1 Tax=Variovorax paradoxus TaxID=34073 RepID=UPI002857CC5F|nr:hypothetical protein [Variovorax paradoxus]MDR6455468.1 hypothetical protein [Variovorax paradoxus]